MGKLLRADCDICCVSAVSSPPPRHSVPCMSVRCRRHHHATCSLCISVRCRRHHHATLSLVYVSAVSPPPPRHLFHVYFSAVSSPPPCHSVPCVCQCGVAATTTPLCPLCMSVRCRRHHHATLSLVYGLYLNAASRAQAASRLFELSCA
jgi:hypothetical protein